jgi:hypothetical protein
VLGVNCLRSSFESFATEREKRENENEKMKSEIKERDDPFCLLLENIST